MADAVIVSTARTPLCKSWRGALNQTHGAKMGGHVVHAALERAKLEPQEVEDVIMGCATPEGATGGNIARQIALRAGLPVTVSGMTVNRFCSSGLQTVALAAQRILAGEGDIAGDEDVAVLHLDLDPAGDQLGQHGSDVLAIVDRRRVGREQAGVAGEAAGRRFEVPGTDQLGQGEAGNAGGSFGSNCVRFHVSTFKSGIRGVFERLD